MAAAGSTRSAAQIAGVLANAQISMTATKPVTASPVSSNTYLGNAGAHTVAATFPTKNPITPRPKAYCSIIPAMVRLRVPISLSTAISRSLPSAMV
jgi:hypothetical protein